MSAIIPQVGQEFSTEFEQGCVCVSEIRDGWFDALDSEGVKCRFHPAMVTSVSQAFTR